MSGDVHVRFCESGEVRFLPATHLVHYATYADQQSGMHTSRPELERMLADARNGEFDTLLVCKVDRLSRRLSDLSWLTERLEKSGVSFRSVSEPFDTTSPTGRLAMDTLALFAECERDTMVERNAAVMASLAGKGKFIGPRAPYGYDIGPGRVLMAAPGEAKVVKIIFSSYVLEWCDPPIIAKNLNADGLLKRCGELWDREDVRRILASRTYVGEVKWRRKWHRGSHEPLVPKAQFDEAQRLTRWPAGRTLRKLWDKRSHLFAGIFECAGCGRHMNAAGNRDGGEPYYYCNTKTPSCYQGVTRSVPLDKAFIADLQDIFEDPGLMETVWSEALGLMENEKRALDEERLRVEALRNETRKRLDRYVLGGEETGAVGLALVRQRADALRRDLATCTERGAALKAEERHLPPIEYVRPSECVALLRKALCSPSWLTGRLALTMFVERAIVDGRREVEAWYRLPDRATLEQLLGGDAPYHMALARHRATWPDIRLRVRYGRRYGRKSSPEILELVGPPTSLHEVGRSRRIEDVEYARRSALCRLLVGMEHGRLNARDRRRTYQKRREQVRSCRDPSFVERRGRRRTGGAGPSRQGEKERSGT